MTIEEWRAQFDRIDQAILALLGERQSIARGLGKWKRERGIPVLNTKRERALIDHLAESRPEGLSREVIERIWNAILTASKEAQTITTGD